MSSDEATPMAIEQTASVASPAKKSGAIQKKKANKTSSTASPVRKSAPAPEPEPEEVEPAVIETPTPSAKKTKTAPAKKTTSTSDKKTKTAPAKKAETTTEKPAKKVKEAAKEGEKKKKRRKPNRNTFNSAIRKLSKEVLLNAEVRKGKKIFYDQLNLGISTYLQNVCNLAASYANGRKGAKTIALRDLHAALLTVLHVGHDNQNDAYNYLVKAVNAVGGDNAGNNKAQFVQRLSDAYGSQFYLTRTRKVRGKEVESTLVNPARIARVYLKKTGVERVANGVAKFLAFHTQVLIMNLIDEVANVTNDMKSKTMNLIHLGIARRDGWYVGHVFSGPSSRVGMPQVLETILLPTKKEVLDKKREAKRNWRQTHPEVMTGHRKQKRMNKKQKNGEATPTKKTTGSVKKTTKSTSKPKKTTASKSKSRSRKTASKSKSRKPTKKTTKKTKSAKKGPNATARKSVKA